MRWRRYDLFTIDIDMHQLRRFVDICLHYLLERRVSGFFIPSPDIVSRFNVLNGDISC